MGYMVAHIIKKELDEGTRDKVPSVRDFRAELKKFGVDEPDPSNARKLAQKAGWTPKGKQGRPPKGT